MKAGKRAVTGRSQHMLTFIRLSRCRFLTVKYLLNLATLKVSKITGEYTSASVGRCMDTPAVIEVLVKAYLEHAKDRRNTLVFCATVDHVNNTVEAFVSAGIEARSIVAQTDQGARQALLDDFKAGKFAVLVNCMVLSEGADLPWIKRTCI